MTRHADSNDLTTNLGSGIGSGGEASYFLPISRGTSKSRSPETPVGGEETPSATGPPEDDQRYLAGEEIGRGGWGRVVRARDQQLNRDVAVKRINPELVSKSVILDRFQQEARVTGGLQHPGVVPVHELGVDAEGAPFYAMKLLEGVTFKEVIRQTHANPKAPPGGYSIALLDRFSDICNAVAYAHQQGILHRDLKPANVMVGAFGETVVVDWGLAKGIEEPRPTDEAESTLAPGEPARSSQASRPTSSGAIVGTPAYMSPEQSQGESGSLSPATDIYALGVILYEVLTGANPFRSKDIETTLSRVRAGQYQPPRSVNRRVPRPLAAICETAMARRPEDRYERAEQIVEDLQRFLAGESVSVYREPWWDKLRRWRRRHPALSASAAVLVLATMIGGALVQEAQRAELEARLAALDRLAESREAGDAWLIELSGSLQFFPGMKGLREGLLVQATEHYQALLDGLFATSDSLTTLERAKCHLRLGDLHRLLGRANESRSHYETTVSLLSDQASPPARIERINGRIGLALLGDPLDLTADATSLRRYMRESQGETWTQSANALTRLALASARREDAPEIGPLAEAETLAEEIVQSRGAPRDHQLLQTVRDELAERLKAEGHSLSAARVWDAEIERLAGLGENNVNRPDVLQALAYARIQRADLLSHGERPDEAASEYRQAIDNLTDAWRLSDADAYYRRNLAASQAGLGGALADPGDAKRSLEEAIASLRRASADRGPSAGDLARLAQCYASLARIARHENDPIAAEHVASADRCYEVLADHGRLSTDLALRRVQLLLESDSGDHLDRAERLLTEIHAETTGTEHDRARRMRAELLLARGENQEGFELLRTLASAECDRAPGESHPIAMQMLCDRLLALTEPSLGELDEAAEWFRAMEVVCPDCKGTPAWKTRRDRLQAARSKASPQSQPSPTPPR